jgi:purine-nucleoside phosphorylase
MQDKTTQEALSILSDWVLPNTHTAIVLGTGLGDFSSRLTDAQRLHTHDIPGFPQSTVEGHKGQLTRGKIQGVPVLVFEGRFHYYEGYSLADIAFPFRLLKFLRIKRLLVSCAAGGLNPHYERSSLMVFCDPFPCFPIILSGGHMIRQTGPHFQIC